MKSIPQTEPLLGEAERLAVNQYLESGGWLTEHTKTKEFEDAVAKFLKVDYCVAVPNGTIGLFLAVKALNLDGEVIVPDFTMIASANAVEMAGATPVLVDINPDTLCIDVSKIKLTKKTQAVLAVNLNGQHPDIGELGLFCLKNGLYLIEDACQAFGAEVGEVKLGTFGDVGVFSLSPHKIITTGQGGLIVTSNKEIYERIKKLKDFGRLKGGEDYYPEIGYNFKFTDLQAVIGLEQLKTIEWRMEKKRQIYEWYFGHKPDFLPWFMPGWSKNRTRTLANLKKAGIGARPFYPPVHTTYKIKGDFPNTELVSAHGYWLPSSLSLTKSDVDYVLEVLSKEVKR